MMRAFTALIGLSVLAFGGCWAVNNRTGEELSSGEAAVDIRGDEEAQPLEAPEPVEPELEPALPFVEGPHFTNFDLLQNRPLAHRITSTEEGVSFWIDAAHPDFVRYIQGNQASDWFPFVELDGQVGAGTKGREAKLTMPASEGAEALQLWVYNPARGDNFLTVKLNGTSLEKVRLDEGWQLLDFDVRDHQVRADNDLGLSFSNLGRIDGKLSGGALGWARLGPFVAVDVPEAMEESLESGQEGSAELVEEDAQDEADGVAEVEDFAEEAEEVLPEGPHQLNMEQGAMALRAGQGLSWVLWVGEDVVLDLELRAEPGCGVRSELFLEEGAGAIRKGLDVERLLVEGHGEVQKTSIDLSLSQAQVARLNLSFAGDEACEEVILSRARLAKPGEQPTRPEMIEKPEYILFWVIDTLRADYLPIHFETNVEAPNLQQLAAEGVSFEVAYVQGTESRASHASLFTALYPERHGVLGRGRVDRNLPILPHFLQEAGYKTSLIAGNGYVSHLLNLNRGWDHYQNNIHDQTGLSARAMAGDGLKWLDRHGDDPFFLYIGTIDPHVTYRRHDNIITLYEPEPYRGRFARYLSGEDLGLIKGRKLSVTEREKEWIINLYKNEITYNDQEFGALRAELEDRGLWDKTLVVITSDHGEEFWEHGSVGHGHNVHQEMVHVPLIFYYPPGLPQGLSLRTGAEIVDVLPTVLDIVGAPALEDRQGRSLLPSIFGEDGGYPAPALATQMRLHYGMQIKNWKLYLRSGRMALYDRRDDVLELEDVRAEHPLASRWLQDSIGWFRAYRERWDKQTWGVANNVSADFLQLLADE